MRNWLNMWRLRFKFAYRQSYGSGYGVIEFVRCLKWAIKIIYKPVAQYWEE